jgi:hypothetical protein
VPGLEGVVRRAAATAMAVTVPPADHGAGIGEQAGLLEVEYRACPAQVDELAAAGQLGGLLAAALQRQAWGRQALSDVPCRTRLRERQTGTIRADGSASAWAMA